MSKSRKQHRPASALDYDEDKSGYYTYQNARTGKNARVWGDDLAAIAFVCESWYSGQSSACYRMMSGDYSYENLDDTLSELERALRDADADEVDEDDYLDLATAVDDLTGIVDRIAKIED